MDRVLYKEILNKREEHQVFIEMEKENPTTKKWYLKHQSGVIEGPFNSFEMDKKYQTKYINEKTKIKLKEDDTYFFLARYIKRYYKKIVS